MLFDVIFPIFVPILIGLLLKKFGVVNENMAQQLMIYVFRIAGPCIIFSSIIHYHLAEVFIWKFWASYALVTILTTLLAYIGFKKIFKSSKIEAVTLGFASSVKNTIMIGFPVLLNIIGQKAAIPMVITVIIFTCVISPFMTFIFEYNQNTQNHKGILKVVSSSLLGAIKNPFVISAILGIGFAEFHVDLYQPIKTALAYISPSFIPCALVAIGIELHSFKIAHNKLKMLLAVIVTFIVCPVSAIIIAKVIKLSSFYAVALTLFSALPSAKSIYIYAKEYNIIENECAAVISLTTLVSLIAIPIYIYVCYLIWPSVFLISSR